MMKVPVYFQIYAIFQDFYEEKLNPEYLRFSWGSSMMHKFEINQLQLTIFLLSLPLSPGSTRWQSERMCFIFKKTSDSIVEAGNLIIKTSDLIKETWVLNIAGFNFWIPNKKRIRFYDRNTWFICSELWELRS